MLDCISKMEMDIIYTREQAQELEAREAICREGKEGAALARPDAAPSFQE
jgi:hypothetical protein